MINFKTFLQDRVDEAELSALQKEYQEYFQAKLKKYKISSPAELDEDQMRNFFESITAGWVKGKGKK